MEHPTDHTQLNLELLSGKKILFVANTGWYLYNFRLSLAERLNQVGCEVVMIFPRDEYAQEIEQRHYRTINWAVGRQSSTPWSEFGSILKLIQIYQQEKPDLVHHFTIKPITYGSLAARWAGVPTTINSVTGKGFVFLGLSRKAVNLQPYIKLLYKIGYRGLNVATTFENLSDRNFFIEEGMVPERDVFLVNGVGVDTDIFTYVPETITETPIILFPGRLLWSKGVGTLVESARILKGRVPVRVVLVGRPDEGNPETIPEPVIREWVQGGVVEWWGWQPNMSPVYHQSHIVALPSMGEGLSKALLEAAACGRPIVATDVPGCREIVIPGVTGYLVPTNQPEALTDKLEKLVRNPDIRRQMGKAGRMYIEESFSDQSVTEDFMRIYERMLLMAKGKRQDVGTVPAG
jgi:glycosyltransferase involved in cell wall biosynthesis